MVPAGVTLSLLYFHAQECWNGFIRMCWAMLGGDVGLQLQRFFQVFLEESQGSLAAGCRLKSDLIPALFLHRTWPQSLPGSDLTVIKRMRSVPNWSYPCACQRQPQRAASGTQRISIQCSPN